MSKKIHFGLDARSGLLRGVQLVTRAVRSTYGPAGRNVIMDRAVGLLATKDGYTVSSEISLDDHLEGMGCELLKEGCLTVNDQVGDGTTTTAILTEALLRETHKLAVAGGANLAEFCKDLRVAADQVIQHLAGLAIQATPELVHRVAIIAANGEVELGGALAEACLAAGEGGLVRIEDGKGVGTEVIYKDGMEIEGGYTDISWLPENDHEVVEGPVVAVVAKILETMEDVRTILEEASQFRPRSVLVFAYRIESQARAVLFMNRHGIQCWPVRCPGVRHQWLEYMKDIAALAGAHLVDPALGEDPSKFRMEWLGSFRSATLYQKKTLVEAYEDKHGFVEQRIAELKSELARTDLEYEQDHLRQRIAKLAGGLVLVKVGGFTEYEAKERRGRAEDALNAIKCALESGVLPGGAKAYLQASMHLGEGVLAERIFKKALQEPFCQLVRNTGEEPSALLDQLEGKPLWWGWDAVLRDFRDFSEEIPDPFAVVEAVIRTSISICTTLLMAECAVCR